MTSRHPLRVKGWLEDDAWVLVEVSEELYLNV